MFTTNFEKYHKKSVLQLRSNFLLRLLKNDLISDFDRSFDRILSSKPGISFFGDQIYIQRIDFSSGASYFMNFNVRKAELFITEQGIELQKLPIDLPLIYSDAEKLDARKLKLFSGTIQKIDPIITVYHHCINRLIVIDGNHRLELAKSRRNESIPAYCLSADGLFQVLDDDLSRLLFIYHNNLCALNKVLFFKGLLPLKIKKSFDKICYYPAA